MHNFIFIFNLVTPAIGIAIAAVLIYAILTKSPLRIKSLQLIFLKMAISDVMVAIELGWGWLSDQYFPYSLIQIHGVYTIFNGWLAKGSFCSIIIWGVLSLTGLSDLTFARMCQVYKLKRWLSFYTGKRYIFIQFVIVFITIILEIALNSFGLLKNGPEFYQDIIQTKDNQALNFFSDVDLQNGVFIFMRADTQLGRIAVLTVSFIGFLATVSVVMGTYLTHRKIFSHTEYFSVEQIRLQRSLTIILAIQLFLPTIIVMVPILIIFAILYLFPSESSQSLPDRWNPTAIGWYYAYGPFIIYSAVNGLFTLLIIKPYKVFLCSLFLRIFFYSGIKPVEQKKKKNVLSRKNISVY